MRAVAVIDTPGKAAITVDSVTPCPFFTLMIIL
jgi:hypothetical protein